MNIPIGILIFHAIQVLNQITALVVTQLTNSVVWVKTETKKGKNLVAAIAGKGQEIDQLAIRDRTVLSQIWEFGSSHPTHLQRELK